MAIGLCMLALLAPACTASSGRSSPSTASSKAKPTASAPPLATGFTPFFLHNGLVSPGHRRPAPSSDRYGTAVRTLIAGPDAVDDAAGLTSAVAKSVAIDNISQQGDVVIVDFNRKFETANTRPQVGQVVYTLTQFPGVDKVQFLIEGQPNGATGVPPQSRADLADMTPQILPLDPAPADQLSRTFTCQGLTQLTGPMTCAVLDAHGHRLASTATPAPTTTSTTTTLLGEDASSSPPGSVEFNQVIELATRPRGPATVVVGPTRAGPNTPLATVRVGFG
jgi:Sporulation and spore germination